MKSQRRGRCGRGVEEVILGNCSFLEQYPDSGAARAATLRGSSMQTRTAARIATSTAKPLLDNDRYFDPDPVVRSAARAIYESTRDLPLICPHGHVDPAIL